jgi:hypothetical protein
VRATTDTRAGPVGGRRGGFDLDYLVGRGAGRSLTRSGPNSGGRSLVCCGEFHEAMTKAELEQKLRDSGIRADAYSVEGGRHDERYCLDQPFAGTWAVYYSERGERTGERRFGSEAEACEYLFDLLIRDPTTQA